MSGSLIVLSGHTEPVLVSHVSLAVAPDGRKTNAEMNIINKSRRRSVDNFMVLSTAQFTKMSGAHCRGRTERERKGV